MPYYSCGMKSTALLLIIIIILSYGMLQNLMEISPMHFSSPN